MVLGPQTSEVQTDESIPVNTPNSAIDKPSTSQIRTNSVKNIHITRANSSSQPNKDVHTNKKDENPPKPTKLDQPKPIKPPKPKIKTDRQQKGSQKPLADHNSYNVCSGVYVCAVFKRPSTFIQSNQDATVKFRALFIHDPDQKPC